MIVSVANHLTRHEPDDQLVWGDVRQRTMVDILILLVAIKICADLVVRTHSSQSRLSLSLVFIIMLTDRLV